MIVHIAKTVIFKLFKKNKVFLLFLINANITGIVTDNLLLVSENNRCKS